MFDFDAIIVGAGVAGSTTASLLGQHGFRVLVLEKTVFPRTKICGEGLMPTGAGILRGLGILPHLQYQSAQPFFGIQFYLPGNLRFELNFSEVSSRLCGWVSPRITLDHLLATHAARQPGVLLREGFTVRNTRLSPTEVEVGGFYGDHWERYSARVLIGADGIHSRFHHSFGVHRQRPRFRRFALRAYFHHLSECRNVVEVHTSKVGEAYVAPLGESRAGITLLLYAPLSYCQKGSLRDFYLKNLRQFPTLWERLADSDPEMVESTAPIALKLSQSHAQRLILVGDAAGAVDPVTGQGMTVALRDAQLACRILKRQLPHDELSKTKLAAYTHQRNLYFGPSYNLAEFLLSSFRHSFLARQAARALSRNFHLRRKILAMATDLSPASSLNWSDRLHLLLGI